MTAFTELSDRVFVLVEPMLRVNVTLVVGDGEALLVDTLSTDDQATELLDAVRRVTTAPLVVVNTHHHFDHCFGNEVIAPPPTPIWAHERAAAILRERGTALQRSWWEEFRGEDPAFADAIARITIRPPDHLVHSAQALTIGGRVIGLRHLGRGHTEGDLVVDVPDADLVIAGDLIEEGAPPGFGDAFPMAWPATVAALRDGLGPATRVIPGHGAPVGRDFVAAQHDELADLAWLIRDGHGDGVPPEKVAGATALTRWGDAGRHEATLAVARGYDELDALI
ncbi:glyoxylase-like metal-dependent hydrolase (beta-lactamase superfamily II) [Allocatelliglobosispora scoriae]|uniref:Glyoxylase-like metal-dependent hydrolase (Beta-lactamase superfamily II) n=2 Tax=Allocatelliglobosispora scoriae TaxID=643052 RepID=A0A841BVJ3_9ACTN|nr:MBL fold metallo-hydrolase [Allocatelliglobosispora scoriae]MBB5873117.1 glyoxylase-like metal-dependent hydrolase (beta-lactamase superfamily II) [Allocatelliglobosispora scoriae]